MKLKALSLRDYRNYAALDYEFGDGITLFSGDNAQGKTNLVEAVYLCCTGRSHRTARDRDLIMHNKDHAYVCVDTVHGDGQHRVELSVKRGGRKSLRINGLPAQRLGEMMGHVNAVIFSPEDLYLVRGDPQGRRRFMDMEISQGSAMYFYNLQNYIKALSQRNALLKQMNYQGDGDGTLDIWEEQLALYGAHISIARQAFFAQLRRQAIALHERIAPDSTLDIRLHACAEAEDYDQAHQQILDKLQRTRQRDIRTQSTGTGPHRDDLSFTIDGRDLRLYGSQGQQRTAAVALKLAELDILHKTTGEMPVLILDDVLSELDPLRRQRLLEAVQGVQTLVTCVQGGEEFAALDMPIRSVRVKCGTLHPQA